MGWNDTGNGGIFYKSSEKIVLASAQRTTSQTSSDIKMVPNPSRTRGLMVVVDITANAGSSANITVTVKGKDPASGAYFTLLASAALSAVATTVLRISPDLAASANLVAKDHIPETIQVSVSHGNSSPITYSVGLIQVA